MSSVLQNEDKQQIYARFYHLLPKYRKPTPDNLWHYTNLSGLIGILQTKKIWSTHVVCMNDRVEHRLFADMVHQVVRFRLQQKLSDMGKLIYGMVDFELSRLDLSTHSRFVASFSASPDDLGQWRGYGGGVCGYAIVFDTNVVLAAAKARAVTNFSILSAVSYDADLHRDTVEYVLDAMFDLYREIGKRRDPPDIYDFTREFLAIVAEGVDIYSALIKHQKFESEAEFRLITSFGKEHCSLEFTQRATMLARHLPIPLTIGSSNRLPIKAVYVGPGPSRRASQVGVGDLLAKFGYRNVPVKMSDIPYRIP